MTKPINTTEKDPFVNVTLKIKESERALIRKAAEADDRKFGTWCRLHLMKEAKVQLMNTPTEK